MKQWCSFDQIELLTFEILTVYYYYYYSNLTSTSKNSTPKMSADVKIQLSTSWNNAALFDLYDEPLRRFNEQSTLKRQIRKDNAYVDQPIQSSMGGVRSWKLRDIFSSLGICDAFGTHVLRELYSSSTYEIQEKLQSNKIRGRML